MKILIIIILLVILLLIAFMVFRTNTSVSENTVSSQKPPVVEYFACGDYCPGDPKKYMKKVYEGVRDKVECEKIGGKPYTYYGVVPNTICLAE